MSLTAETRDLCQRIDAFLETHVLPLEQDSASFGEGEHIRDDLLQDLRAKARDVGLWCFQMPRDLGGVGQSIAGMAASYEAAGRSIFGPAIFNVAAPDDGNMYLLNKVATPAQKERWLMPIIRGEKRSALAMTEPQPGAGSDPAGMMLTRAEKRGDRWIV